MTSTKNKNLQTDKFFEKLFINAPIGIYIEQERTFQFVNPTFLKLTGFERKELIGTRPFTYVFPEDRNFVKKKVVGMLKGHHSSPFEFRVVIKSGETRWIVETVAPIQYSRKRALVGYYMDITHRKQMEEALKRSEEELRSLSAHLQTIREEERTRIAREIHDELGQALTALKMDFSLLNKRLKKEHQLHFNESDSILSTIDMTIQTVQRISSELRPRLLDVFGLGAAIEWQSKDFQKRMGIKCEVTQDPEDITLPQDLSTAIFRIFQETLTNVARHANANRVDVYLHKNSGQITMRVKDDGKGITDEEILSHRSLGLIGIRERVRPWGGAVNISGDKDKGSTVTVSIPFDSTGKNR